MGKQRCLMSFFFLSSLRASTTVYTNNAFHSESWFTNKKAIELTKNKEKKGKGNASDSWLRFLFFFFFAKAKACWLFAGTLLQNRGRQCSHDSDQFNVSTFFSSPLLFFLPFPPTHVGAGNDQKAIISYYYNSSQWQATGSRLWSFSRPIPPPCMVGGSLSSPDRSAKRPLRH